MRVATNCSLFLFILLLGLVLVSPAVAGVTANCPVEPAPNTSIASGQSYAGSNCTLNSPTDVDSFVFSGVAGYTFHLAVAINGAAPSNICLAIYDPSFVRILHRVQPMAYQQSVLAVVTDQKLTATGTYTMVVTEATTSVLNYGVSLVRLYPFPPSAQKLSLGIAVPGNITPLTDTDPFTFDSLTTCTYRVSGTLPPSASQNLCMNVYASDGTLFKGNVCTASIPQRTHYPGRLSADPNWHEHGILLCTRERRDPYLHNARLGPGRLPLPYRRRNLSVHYTTSVRTTAPAPQD